MAESREAQNHQILSNAVAEAQIISGDRGYFWSDYGQPGEPLWKKVAAKTEELVRACVTLKSGGERHHILATHLEPVAQRLSREINGLAFSSEDPAAARATLVRALTGVAGSMSDHGYPSRAVSWLTVASMETPDGAPQKSHILALLTGALNRVASGSWHRAMDIALQQDSSAEVSLRGRDEALQRALASWVETQVRQQPGVAPYWLKDANIRETNSTAMKAAITRLGRQQTPADTMLRLVSRRVDSVPVPA